MSSPPAPTAAPTERAPAVRARHAASLLVVRDGTSVLMGLRGHGHRFMPNRLVFPGGAVERRDATAPAASEPHPATLAMLGRCATPALSRALVMAAARELEEETALTLGTPPALDGMRFLARAVTPAVQPVRFNARFLVVDAALVSGTLAGSGELEDLRWYDLEEAAAMPLALPTAGVLERLRRFLALPEAERDAERPTEVMLSRVWTGERAPSRRRGGLA